jgi:hypothetical protein
METVTSSSCSRQDQAAFEHYRFVIITFRSSQTADALIRRRRVANKPDPPLSGMSKR